MRKSTATALTAACACLLLVLAAPVASAGLVDDTIGTIDDTIGGGGSDSTGDSGSGSGSGGSDPVGDVVGGIDGAIGGGDSGSTGDDGSSKDDTNLVDGVVGGVEKTLEDPKTEVDKTTDETTGSISGPIGGTVGGVVGGVEKTLDETTKTLTGRNKEKDGKAGDGTAEGVPSVQVFHDTLAGALQADAERSSAELVALSSSFVGDDASETAAGSVIQQIGRVAAEAAQQVAFPLLLTLMVMGFLMLQNKIDRRDPKLAMAPIDTEQDLLSFS